MTEIVVIITGVNIVTVVVFVRPRKQKPAELGSDGGPVRGVVTDGGPVRGVVTDGGPVRGGGVVTDGGAGGLVRRAQKRKASELQQRREQRDTDDDEDTDSEVCNRVISYGILCRHRWRRSIVVRTLVSAGELSLSCVRLLAG